MTVQQLKYLVTIADEGGINEAAKRMKVTQPTVTMQIRKLERELKVTLFDRKNYPLQLTQIGTILTAQAKIILKEADLMQDIIKNYKRGILSNAREPLLTKDKELKEQAIQQQKVLKKVEDSLEKLIQNVTELKAKSLKL